MSYGSIRDPGRIARHRSPDISSIEEVANGAASRRRSGSSMFGIPTIIIGVIAFGAFLSLSLVYHSVEHSSDSRSRVDQSSQLGVWTAGHTQVVTSQRTQPPNIIFFLVDDMGYNDVGYANDDFSDLTPVISALKSEGVSLETYYTQQICTPARAALLTGRYPFKTGMQTEVIQPQETWGLPEEYQLLPDLLKPLGYSSHLVGKWHLGHATQSQLPTSRGFDDSYGMLATETHYYTHISTFVDMLDFMDATAAGSDSEASVSCEADKTGEYSTKLHTDRGIDIISRWADTAIPVEARQPFFLQMSYQSPHSPPEASLDIDYEPVRHILDSLPDQRVTTAKMVYGLDVEVGRLMDSLKENGALDSTLIIFTSDNGGCSRYGQSNFPFRGTKHYNFEGSSRVRAFLSGSALQNARISTPASYLGMFHAVDWLPTIMEFVGGTSSQGSAVLNGIDGVSHVSALRGEGAPPRDEVIYNIEEFVPQGSYIPLLRGAIRQGDWKLLMNEGCQEWDDFGGRYDALPYKGACEAAGLDLAPICSSTHVTSTADWLFNLKDDPYETRNVIKEYPDIAETLQKRLFELAVGEGRQSVRQVSPRNGLDVAIQAWSKTGCVGPWDSASVSMDAQEIDVQEPRQPPPPFMPESYT